MTSVEELKKRVSRVVEGVSVEDLIESEVLCNFIEDLEYFLETNSINSLEGLGE